MKKRGRFKIKTWQLILIMLPLLLIDATLLRLDHIKMTELRDAVLQADESEDDEKTMGALNELKNFVFSNIVINIVEENGNQKIMFGTGPFYLEHQYIRAANAALKAAEERMQSDTNPNGNIYATAASVCQPQAIANGWSWNNANYINCMMAEINKYPSANEIQDQIKASLPSTELYRKNYASPVWAPTLSGFAILITLLIIVVIFIKVIIWIVLRLALLFV